MKRITSFLSHANLWMVLAAGLIVRLIGIWWRPIWHDEAISLIMGQRTLSDFLHATLSPVTEGVANVHPPGFFLLFMQWTRVFGSSVVAGRVFAILFGMLALWLGVVLAKRVLPSPTARHAGWLLAFSPFLVHYSQEIRMYSMVTAGVVAAAYAYRRTSDSGFAWRWLVLFAVGAAFAQYSHSSAAFYLIALAAWPLVTRNWPMVRFVFLGGLIAVVLYIPWLSNVISQISMVATQYWVAVPGVNEVLNVLISFITFLPLPIWLGFFPLYVYLLLGILVLIGWRRGTAEKPEEPVLWVAWMAFAPLIASFVVSQSTSVFLLRTFLPTGFFILLLVAWMIDRAVVAKPMRRLLWAFLGVSMAAGLVSFYTFDDLPYAPFDVLAKGLETEAGPDEVIVHSHWFSVLPTTYFSPDLQQVFIQDEPGSVLDNLHGPVREVLGVVERADIIDAAAEAQGVWLVVSKQNVEGYQLADGTDGPELTWLRDEMVLAGSQSFGDLEVYHFRRP